MLAPLTALAAFRDLQPLPRTAAALVVGLAYVVASYFAQGAFKETMLALFLLGFVLFLRESRARTVGLPLRFVPAALIAVGAVYTYSFPGPALAARDRGGVGRDRRPPARSSAGGAPAGPQRAGGSSRRRTGDRTRGRAAVLSRSALVVLVAPEIGRMIDFHKFETFDPNGPGLGNLFGQVSPFEALGIWPSGDFRLAPGDGAVPPRPITSAPPSAPCSSSTASGPAGAGARPSSSPASSSPRSPTSPPGSAAPPTPPARRSRSPRPSAR